MNEYRGILLNGLPDLPSSHVYIPRFGLSLKPWDDWNGPTNPLWWRSYNKVKHERDRHFAEATLKNALNALAALLLLTFHYYTRELAKGIEPVLTFKETTRQLQPASTLLRLPEDYYHSTLFEG